MDPHPDVAPRAARIAVLLALMLALVGCGTATPEGEPGSGSPEALTIVIADFTFVVPDSVPAGATVTVRNDDNVGHTVTSDEPGGFDVPVGPGEQVTFTAPDEPGEYPFHCTPHPQMTATLVVG